MKNLNWIILIALFSLLTGCSRYSFTVNEQPVFDTPRLFTGYRITDRALAECVAQAIADQNVSEAEGLTRLVCSQSGVTSLNGLEVFSGLAYINLAENQLTNIAPLLQLGSLRQLDLRKNPALNCKELSGLGQEVPKLSVPEHCKS